VTPQQDERLVKAVEGIYARVWWVAFWLYLIFCFTPSASEIGRAVKDSVSK
jgi:hypothetical protein